MFCVSQLWKDLRSNQIDVVNDKACSKNFIQIDRVVVDEIMIEENGIQPFEVDNVQPSSETLMKGVEIDPTPFFSLEVRLFLLIMINWITNNKIHEDKNFKTMLKMTLLLMDYDQKSRTCIILCF